MTNQTLTTVRFLFGTLLYTLTHVVSPSVNRMTGPGDVPLNTTEFRVWQFRVMTSFVAIRTYSGCHVELWRARDAAAMQVGNNPECSMQAHSHTPSNLMLNLKNVDTGHVQRGHYIVITLGNLGACYCVFLLWRR